MKEISDIEITRTDVKKYLIVIVLLLVVSVMGFVVIGLVISIGGWDLLSFAFILESCLCLFVGLIYLSAYLKDPKVLFGMVKRRSKTKGIDDPSIILGRKLQNLIVIVLAISILTLGLAPIFIK